jgi:uncharacterized membrane protein YgcG
MPSPKQPTEPLKAAELAKCVAALSASGWQTSGVPIVVTYATSVPNHWLLAKSAALHGVPLVLAGLGRRGWQWYQGGGGKLKGTARALQLLHALAPDSPIVFADGGDTVIANPWSDAAAERVRQSADILTGGECNSWPLCYNASYLRDAHYRTCIAEHPTCYPNSGTYLGHAAALHAFVSGLRGTMDGLNARGYAGRLVAEKGDDQAALHHLYLSSRGVAPAVSGGGGGGGGGSSASNSGLRVGGSSSGGGGGGGAFATSADAPPNGKLRIDGANEFFLSLFVCNGKRYKLRGQGPFEYCHEKPFDAMPLLHTVSNGSGLLWQPQHALNGAPPHRPFLLHANGKHYRLTEKRLAPLMRRLASDEASAAAERSKVLLVDSVAMGTCGVASLGRVLRGDALGSPAGGKKAG